jgi:hypothetical protein
MDKQIRRVIFKKLEAKQTPKNFYYTRNRDAGLGIMNLRERYPTCEIVNLAHLVTSEIGSVIRDEINYIAYMRDIPTNREQKGSFFDRSVDENSELDHISSRYNCDVMEALRAVKRLGIQIFFSNQDEKNICLGRKENALFNSFDDSVESLSKILMEDERNDYGDRLCSMLGCGSIMIYLRNYRQSNFMFNYYHSSVKNGLIKFIVKSRTGQLKTPDKKYKIGFGDEESRYCKCKNHREVCNILHILNGYKYYLPSYTRRHNWITGRIAK